MAELDQAIKAQIQRDQDPNITQIVTDEIKESVVFQQPWQDLLQSMPVSIYAIGALFVASSSDAAQQAQLEQPNKGFRYIQDDKLAAALIRCGEQGRLAFMEAMTGLSFVDQITKRASAKVRSGVKRLSLYTSS
jgi:hypothetical protein